MVLGTGLLLVQGGYSLADIQRKISVPGGITEKALGALRERLAGLFDGILEETHRKFCEDAAALQTVLEKRSR